MIEGKMKDDVAAIMLNEHGFGEVTTINLVSIDIDSQDIVYDWLHLRLYDEGIPNMITVHDNVLLILLPTNSDGITILDKEIPSNLHIGVSNASISRLNRMQEVFEESMWALQSAASQKKRIDYYSENSPISPFIPRNRENAQALVEQVLGKLLAYDTINNSQLVKTLYIYLSETRSWKSTAEKIHIHKQTLVYRINRIQKITEKRLDDINDISELWIALQTAMMLTIIPNYTNELIKNK
ncbi:helix-turn-helix domain-containing protein [Virgibacillus sp. C22-A2]|uniref:Helix-turn-helix domain-containing protein n=1 Tax=Virgibacillus tibetensis TaxID=3042313 RepID=A0ABU6KL67_9BACI|nr:helix-turn-helix domain-containing protein [Virgibacillus sp. C22-A2]